MCCGAVGWLPPGFYFSGNGKRAKRPSVINNHIRAAQKHNMLACRHFLTHGPTGWELHNRSAKLLILILNCFGSFIVCKCGRVAFCDAWLSGGITVMVSCEWFYILSSLPCNWSLFLLFTMPPSWSLFAGNVLSLPPCASLDLHGTQFFSIKNVLFLVHCVKTWLSHPVYVWVH